MARVTIRIDLSDSEAVGPGRIRLLELIRQTGSISGAGRAMDMSYRRAWLLVEELNHLFREPVAVTKLGGRAGGGAELTPFGHELIRRYRDMENAAHAAVSDHLAQIHAAMKPARSARPRKVARAG